MDTPKGIRDSAMLELLYATGMRVSEMLHLQIFDVNLQFGYVVCNENGKERIIPIGIPCKKAMERYLQTARTVFVKDEKETALFTNCSGKAMSRQGFWKVCCVYAAEWCGYTKRSGNAGTFRYFHYAGLSGHEYE